MPRRVMRDVGEMACFLDLAQANGGMGKRWDDIGLGRYGLHNRNKVLAQTSDICESNSAGTYLGLVAFLENGNDIPKSEAGADRLARRIKPLLIAQGMPSFEKYQTYISPEGKSIAPVAVIYEHQFLAYQIGHRGKAGALDSERVLLYPSARFVTEPKLIALSDAGDRLGRLVSTDPALQERAMELGFRLRDADSGLTSVKLNDFLTRHQIPAPVTSTDDTRAVLPDLALLERMIETVGQCDPTGQAVTGQGEPVGTTEGSP
ncbi:hypothetical protein [Streptomyces sp. NPDC047453]|uniref:hypothetical protein n=1 Tax=Streptomyces sp. NPDC047453 TaxID=3154812 RepID=UPI0033C7C6A7